MNESCSEIHEALADEQSASDMEKTILAAVSGDNSSETVDPTMFRKTDVGNADLFSAMFGKDLRYVEAWRTWMIWNGLRWIEASDMALISFAKKATNHMILWATTLPDQEREGLLKHALSTQKKERLMAMIQLAKGHEAIRLEPKNFDADPWVLGCASVTIDLRSGKPRAPQREDYITKSTGVDPDFHASCPNWLEFLDWALNGDQETLEHIKRVMGYMLTGEVSEELLFCFVGGGSNGKTTVVMTLYEMLGDYASKARSDLLMQAQGEKGAASPDVANLHGRRLVVVSETDASCTLAEAQVKQITSNEPITARRLHRDLFTFIPTHKTLLMTNHRPFVKGTDDGIWRRLSLVPFVQKIEDKDKIPDFRATRLLPELPAVLAWAIQGVVAWKHDGLGTSVMVKQQSLAYREEMDYVAAWMKEQTVSGPKYRACQKDTYADFKFWAYEDGSPALGKRKFFEELHMRGYKTIKSNGRLYFDGFRLTKGFHPIEWNDDVEEIVIETWGLPQGI